MHTYARMTAYRLGLLEPEEALEVRRHLRGCEECREAFEPFRELSEEEERRPGHLPIALLTRWDAFAPLLTEDERTCLEGHLETCPRCMESRAFARLIPELPQLHERPDRRVWISLGAAAAAGLALVLAVLLRGTTPQVATQKPGTVTTPVAVPAPVADVLRAPLLSLTGVDRGSATPVISVPKGASVLPIRVPPLLGVGPDAHIEIRVEGPGGLPFGEARIAHRKLFGTSSEPSLDARAPSGPLPEGAYKVLVTSDAPNPQVPGGFEGAEYGFDLRTTL